MKALIITSILATLSFAAFSQDATLKPSTEMVKSKKEKKKEAKAEEKIHEKSRKEMDKQTSAYYKKHYKKDFKLKPGNPGKGDEGK